MRCKTCGQKVDNFDNLRLHYVEEHREILIDIIKTIKYDHDGLNVDQVDCYDSIISSFFKEGSSEFNEINDAVH